MVFPEGVGRLVGIELQDVTAENWRDVVRVEPREGRRRFVASVAYCLSYWIGGLTIAAEHQGKGYGRAAVEALLDFLATQPGYREAAPTCRPENTVARRLYAGLGFVETGEHSEDELVARRPAGGSMTTRGGG